MIQMSKRMGRALVIGCAALLAGAVVASAAAPEPDPVPKRWQLDLQTGPLRVISVETDAGPMSYYYMTYLVTNNSGEDLLFAPAWDLATDEGTIIRSGRDVPRLVTAEILAMHDNPLLEDQISVIGPLLQGRENAKEGLVVWPADDLDIDRVNVYAAGFSGEFKMYEVGSDPDEVERFVLRKTYSLRYCVGGFLDPSANQELVLCERPRWIMR